MADAVAIMNPARENAERVVNFFFCIDHRAHPQMIAAGTPNQMITA
jgi:hypothetical protein